MHLLWLAALLVELTSANYQWINPAQASLSSDKEYSSDDVHGIDSTIDLQWVQDQDPVEWNLEIAQQSNPDTRRCVKCPIEGLTSLFGNIADARDLFNLTSDPLDYVIFFTLSNRTVSVQSRLVKIIENAVPIEHRDLGLNRRASRRKKGLSEQMKWCIGLIAGVSGGLVLGVAFVYLYKWSMKKQRRPVTLGVPLPYGGS